MDSQQLNKTCKRWKTAGTVTGFAIVLVILFGRNIILSLHTGHFLLWPPLPQGLYDLIRLIFSLTWCFGIFKNKTWLMPLSLTSLWTLTAIDISMYCNYLKGPKNGRYTEYALDFEMPVMFSLPLTALRLIFCISATVCYVKIKKATQKLETQPVTVTYDVPKCGVVAPV